MIKKAKQIIEGYSNLSTKKENVEKIANKRLEVCNSCDLNSNYVCDPFKFKEVEGNKIYGCGCYLPAKARSSSKCPLSKW